MNKYGIIIIIIITKIIFKRMNVNSGFLKNWTLMIEIFKRNKEINIWNYNNNNENNI